MNPNRLKRIERIKWLMRNRKLWNGFPDSKQYLLDQPERVLQWKVIVGLMKSAGVLSRKTYWMDVGLVKLIAKARRCLSGKDVDPFLTEISVSYANKEYISDQPIKRNK